MEVLISVIWDSLLFIPLPDSTKVKIIIVAISSHALRILSAYYGWSAAALASLGDFDDARNKQSARMLTHVTKNARLKSPNNYDSDFHFTTSSNHTSNKYQSSLCWQNVYFLLSCVEADQCMGMVLYFVFVYFDHQALLRLRSTLESEN